ncbi:hypothetical protein OC187_01910 [Anaplasma capra]|nr:hypothetical protein [Anaplasma capra]
MLSFGMGFKIFLVLGSTFILQYSIWNINWKIVPIMVLRFFKRCIFSIRYGKSALRGAVVRINVNGFDNIRNKIIDEIDDGLQDIWGTILISRKQKTTEEDLTSLKKSLLIKISYQIDEFIHNALKSIEK